MRPWNVAVSALVAVVLSLASQNALAGVIALPQTGVTACFDPSGLEIPCAGTGQDGELRAGAAWPAPRFANQNDGTLLDNLTGLTWTADAGTPAAGSCIGGVKSWQAALDYVACLNSTGYLGRTDWRLPNVNELESLLNISATDSRPWLNSQGFVNVGTNYWSSTTTASTTLSAWYLAAAYGYPASGGKTANLLVWPVR